MYLPNTFTFFFCSRLVASILLPYPNNQNVSDEAIAFVVEEKNSLKLILAVEDTNFLKILEFIHRSFNFRVNIHNDLSIFIYLGSTYMNVPDIPPLPCYVTHIAMLKEMHE